jgi:hypothetical protein
MAVFKNAADLDEIESDITALRSRFHILSIGYDLVTVGARVAAVAVGQCADGLGSGRRPGTPVQQS